jgi:2,3-diketo-5-methylthio-1-phosphopentane phosphatase
MQIFCDFDGTITNRDSIVFLTEEFGGGEAFRLEVLDDIKTGRMTVFEAIERELATVKVGWEEAVASLKASVYVDPTFGGFVEYCSDRDLPLTVVSSGMEPVVELFVDGFGIPFLAHPVEVSRTGWAYRRNPRHDKKAILKSAKEAGEIVFIGDGTSDVAAVQYSDILFAKRGQFLAEYCRGEGVPYHPFTDFRDVQRTLDEIGGIETTETPRSPGFSG